MSKYMVLIYNTSDLKIRREINIERKREINKLRIHKNEKKTDVYPLCKHASVIVDL